MNCNEWFDRLYQILDRDLDETLWQDLQVHMKSCRACWDRFEFEKRPPIDVKGKGAMQTYLVIGQKPDPQRAVVTTLG